MNEITAAIKKKAEEKYNGEEDGHKEWHTDQQVTCYQQSAYTCGGEDAIGFMLKFFEWVNSIPDMVYHDKGYRKGLWDDGECVPMTTEQLLLKYMESNEYGK